MLHSIDFYQRTCFFRNLAKCYNNRGIVSGGLLPGYAKHKGNLTPDQYIKKVLDGELVDATLNFQLNSGFQVLGIIDNYIDDSASDNQATLIYWENPDYKADSA